MISPTYDIFKAKVIHVSKRLGIPLEELKAWSVKSLYKTYDLLDNKFLS